MAQTLPNVPRPAPRKMFSASVVKSERVDATGKELSDREIARRFGRRIERAMALAGITPQDAQHRCGYANQSPISKLINPEQAPAIARLMEIDGFIAAWIDVLADECPQYEREVTYRRRA